ncbi:MAG: hypothetical protein Q9205_005437 [Flavoplaca limonia]
MNSLVRFSRMNSHDPVGQCYTETGPAWDASISLPGGVAPPGRPAPLRVRWVFETVRLIPEWMPWKQRFAEVEMGCQSGCHRDGDRLNTAMSVLMHIPPFTCFEWSTMD